MTFEDVASTPSPSLSPWFRFSSRPAGGKLSDIQIPGLTPFPPYADIQIPGLTPLPPCSIRERITVAYFTIRLFFTEVTPLTLLAI
jgi:hypothetical protein